MPDAEVLVRYADLFDILDRDCSLAICHALRRTAEERSRLPAEFMNDSMGSEKEFWKYRYGDYSMWNQ